MESLTGNKKNIEDCVFCGNCKTNCPTYNETSLESMSARGRVALMRQLTDNMISPSAKLNSKIFSCILCGACDNSCPLNIDITQSIYNTRVTLKDLKKNTKFLIYIIKHLFSNTDHLFFLLRLLKLINNRSFLRFKPLIDLFNITQYIPIKPLNKTLSLSKTINPIGRIALFPGCTSNLLITQIGLDMIDILNTLNYDVVIPRGIVCCGAPMMSIGLQDKAKEQAERNIEIFNKLSIDKIISLCPTCVYTMSKTYKNIVGQDVSNIVDSTTFIIEKWQTIKNLCHDLDKSFIKSKVIYHHPCHTKNYIHIKSDSITDILKDIGLNVVIDDTCCGFGGLFKILEEELSSTMLKKKKEKFATMDMVISACPNCIIQYRTGNINSLHFVEVIKNSLRG